jgi:predicted dehydrogenase
MVAHRSPRPPRPRIRYAVVGAGHIAQNAVLPAFAHARENSEITVLFSDDERKRRVLGKRFRLEETLPYTTFDEACRADLFDAVYITLPNSMHREYTERAAAARLHILCEKPMATTAADCRAMIDAAESAGVKLMIAYRLHFEPANTGAMKIARSGKLGNLRLFNSVFTMQVRQDNIRTDGSLGGGPLFDIGIYCINAARYMFADEPLDVVASIAQGEDPRFKNVEEAVSAVFRFPDERLASFTCSFGAADAGYFQVIGSKGDLCLDPAYEYEGALEQHLTIRDKTRTRKFRPSDQFAPELVYFSDCIKRGINPEPGGIEGLNDVAIIEAIHESARTGRRIPLTLDHDKPPSPSQKLRKPPVRNKKLVRVQSGHQD